MHFGSWMPGLVEMGLLRMVKMSSQKGKKLVRVMLHRGDRMNLLRLSDLLRRCLDTDLRKHLITVDRSFLRAWGR